jgi:hypothetical protein
MRWAGNFEGTRNTFVVKSHREGKVYRDHICGWHDEVVKGEVSEHDSD